MNFKRCLSLFLICVTFCCFLNVSASSTNTNLGTKRIEDLRIVAPNVKVDTESVVSKDVKGDKTIIHTKGINSISSNRSKYMVAQDTGENHAPIADLRYVILNPDTLTPEGYPTTATQIAWLWYYNGTSFTYDLDGDAIVDMRVGGIPSSSIISYATDDTGNAIGFVTQIPTSGQYTMTFMCQDEHGLWSNILSVPFYINRAPMIAKAIACGDGHTVALKEDGTVWAWGANGYGQLGDGTTTLRTIPVQVKDLSGIVAVECGYSHSVALKSDGTVWTWGWNSLGQLGNGTSGWNDYKSTPVQVTGLSGVKAIAASMYNTAALKTDGTVWTWGQNTYGQLGDGTTTDKSTPVQVIGLNGVTAMGCGSGFMAVLRSNGIVCTWGGNLYGQCGNPTQKDQYTPTVVSYIDHVIALAVESGSTEVLKNDGTVWGWGYNGHGELGDGTTLPTLYNRTKPVQAIGVSGVSALAGGSSHTIALKEDGTIWTWGNNSFGQLGIGTTSQSTTPVKLTGINGIKAIAGGGYYSVALKEDGTVWAWGHNMSGQLGDGTTTDRYSPIQVVSSN